MSHQDMPALDTQMVGSNNLPEIGHPIPALPRCKRPMRMRSEKGQNKGNHKKKGRGKAQNDAAPFLEKTYEMITTCKDTIAAWSDCGEHFIIKDTEIFAKQVIPQFFEHNKFPSFSRQLNFYGFKKVPTKTLRKDEISPAELKWVRFKNEDFKKDRKELLVNIQRATRDPHKSNSQAQETANLKKLVSTLESEVNELKEANSILHEKVEQILAYFQDPNEDQAHSAAGGYVDVSVNPQDQFQDARNATLYTSAFAAAPVTTSGGGKTYSRGPPSHNYQTSKEGTSVQQATLPPHPKAKQLRSEIAAATLPQPLDTEFLRGFSSNFSENLFVTIIQDDPNKQGSPSHNVDANGSAPSNDSTRTAYSVQSKQDSSSANTSTDQFPLIPIHDDGDKFYCGYSSSSSRLF